MKLHVTIEDGINPKLTRCEANVRMNGEGELRCVLPAVHPIAQGWPEPHLAWGKNSGVLLAWEDPVWD